MSGIPSEIISPQFFGGIKSKWIYFFVRSFCWQSWTTQSQQNLRGKWVERNTSKIQNAFQILLPPFFRLLNRRHFCRSKSSIAGFCNYPSWNRVAGKLGQQPFSRAHRTTLGSRRRLDFRQRHHGHQTQKTSSSSRAENDAASLASKNTISPEFPICQSYSKWVRPKAVLLRDGMPGYALQPEEIPQKIRVKVELTNFRKYKKRLD